MTSAACPPSPLRAVRAVRPSTVEKSKTGNPMKTPFHHPLIMRLAPVVLTASAAWAGQACGAVTAILKPQSISLGRSAQLVVTVQNEESGEVVLPDVPGLQFSSAGMQRSMSFGSGGMNSVVSYIYRVTPQREGTFTVPAISAGGTGSSKPLTLTVTQGSGNARAGNGQAPPPGVKDGGPNAEDAKDKMAFLRVVLPKKELVVGELVPVQIKAYIREGITVSRNGLPTLSSDAFTLNPLSDRVTKEREYINGVPFIAVTWTSSLSAVKAGEYPLDLTMPLIARVRERGTRRNIVRDAFGNDISAPGAGFEDPFFDEFFGRSTEKDLTMHTAGDPVRIHEIPVEGRPADFSGAVGKFDITSSVTPAAGAAGDPLTLKLGITGEGNFNRVTTDGLGDGPEWKTYPPSASFAARDSSETSGVKTFTQSVIPLKAGARQVPSVPFSYYDPDSKQFVTKRTEPVAVTIRPGAAPVAASPSTSVSTEPAAPEPPKPGPDGLMPDKALPPAASSTLRALVRTPWFIAANAGMAGALVLGLAFRRVRARLSAKAPLSPKLLAERAVAESLSAMEAAMRERDAPRFFEAARRAVQERLGAQWNLPASRVTLPEIRSRLNGQGGEVRALFETADEIAYAGRRFSTPDLQQWRDLVRAQLQQLAKS
ncbi:MAG: hypothetical protein EOP86_01675 [Verrucomicrobiaceae bacterium]|nr:MAG: hypothetical protein EOP86_01675 [Verrucomicrobiaceae bacterium]